MGSPIRPPGSRRVGHLSAVFFFNGRRRRSWSRRSLSTRPGLRWFGCMPQARTSHPSGSRLAGRVRMESARSPWLVGAPENLWYPAASNCDWAVITEPARTDLWLRPRRSRQTHGGSRSRRTRQASLRHNRRFRAARPFGQTGPEPFPAGAVRRCTLG